MQKISFLCFIIFVVPSTQVIGMSDEDKFREAVENENITEIRNLITTKKVSVDYYPLNINFDTAFLIAVRKNNIKMAEELLRLGAYIFKHNNREETPLLLAVKNNNLPMVQMLLSNSKDLNPFYLFYHEENIDRIVNRSDEVFLDSDKRPLFLAIQMGNIDIIKAILNEVPDPNFQISDSDPSSLEYAEDIKDTTLKNEIVSLLKTVQKQYALFECARKWKDCADSNFTPDVLAQNITNPQRNPLFAAINAGADGNSRAIEQFIKKGINVNQTVRGGMMPLMEAARKERYDMIKFFLENGADPLAKNTEGKTALDILKEQIAPTTPYYKTKYDDAIANLTAAEIRWKKTKEESPNLIDYLQNLIQKLRKLDKALK